MIHHYHEQGFWGILTLVGHVKSGSEVGKIVWVGMENYRLIVGMEQCPLCSPSHKARKIYAEEDWLLFLVLGAVSAVIGYSVSQAYRSANAATVAPFEYAALPLSIFWGWMVFGHLPDLWVMCGIVMIATSGVYVFLREGTKKREVASGRPVRRV